MEGIIAIIMIFGMPVFIIGVNKYFQYKKLKLQADLKRLPEDKSRVDALEKERALLEKRIENLETIICSVDFELNAKLNRLAAQQSQLFLAPKNVSAKTASLSLNTTPPEEVQTATQAPTGELPLGSLLIGRYQIQQLLGRGGMGAVYLAHDQQLGELVALKVVARELAEEPTAIERFRREASSARKITHPNVIRIHDLGEANGLLFLSMEYFEGLTLEAILRRRRTLPLEETQEILFQVCDALNAAQHAGVIHRDLKPPNILINERRLVKVIDFGLAKATFFQNMTATGLIMGTPEYMAPERLQGGTIDHRTDIYSLGILAYHMICGQPPFIGENPITVGFQHCTQSPTPPRFHKPELPVKIEAAILRCMAKNPLERFSSANDFKAAIAS